MTQLIRTALKTAFSTAKDANAALLLQRGWANFTQQKSANEAGSKTEHIARICGIPASPFYTRAYDRWLENTSGANFLRLVLKVDNRLLIGLSGGGALETGCALSHNHGMPYIPGSSIKGAVRAWAEAALSEHKALFDELFGAKDSSSAALLEFYDAWWVPHSAPGHYNNRPFVQDIVTTHHAEYYQGKGAAASDLDSPVPNALVAVQGSFVFVVGTVPDYAPLVKNLLQKALAANGIGAKTASGYGYFSADDKRTKALTQQANLAQVADLPPEQQQDMRLRHELQAMSEEALALMFSKNRNQTKARPDFEQLLAFVKTEYSSQISGWPQKSANFVKAYKFLHNNSGSDD
ncbi:type III-B CRISPR module RAMP protein Cmr6 [Rheinheimera sediminis]|uniref:type III-B CRISPR module RAMP protein Cmr6 n=1 Tax=Rheinheimera sp. YQF-1 TaxID=2499626 RepID=UPI000FD6F176|nr:type III-B CRISPR module RAMP protein Cmr6 [Rheinheimera sp. YQF-1]RVT47828.1 type III-B CRISPR module RAMP protein Cmr6 [Rheinheimera sp. YQF-1]